MKRTILLIFGILMMLGLSSCGGCDRGTAFWKGESRMCVDGVQYLQFTSGASVAYNTNGTIKTCK